MKAAKKKVRQKQFGFTLIELVIIITILALLAVMAIPRYISVKVEARKAVLDGIDQSIHSVEALARAKYKVVNNESATTVDMDGTTVNVIAGTGRPTAETGGIDTAMRFKAGAESKLNTDLGVTNATQAVFYYGTNAASSGCKVTYDETTGLTTVVKTDCT